MAMKLKSIREIVAIVLIFGHLIAIGLVFFKLKDYFRDISDRLEFVFILAPITGLYAVAALKYILRSPEKTSDDAVSNIKVSSSFALTTTSIPIVFTAFILYTLYTYPFGVANDPKSLRMTISAVEAGIGILLGLVAETLFSVDLKEVRKSVSSQSEAAKKQADSND